MGQIIQFTGNERQAASFSAKIDGKSYLCEIRYNFVSQRWYLRIKNQSSIIVLNIALVGSVKGSEINLLRGVFKTTSIVWYRHNGQIEVSP